jgi:preprotein translocase subunit SecG
MLFGLLLTILIIDAILLMVVILLQAGTGGGLAAMGGSASTDTLLGGRQATTILTRATWWMGGIFLGLALILTGVGSGGPAPQSVLDTEPVTAPTPVAPPTQLPLDLEEAPPGQPGTENPPE